MYETNRTKNACCDPAALAEFLHESLSPQREEQLVVHLNSCDGCRSRLRNAAGESGIWMEFEAALRDQPDDSVLLSSETERRCDSAATESIRIDQVIDMLGPTDDPAMLGRIGGYEVAGVIGSGGMGVVLKAQDRSLDRIVAIKVMAPHLACSGSARKRFAREAKAAAAVLHPNVISIHSVSNDDALPYLVMPYIRGKSLQKRIDAQGPMPLEDVLRIGMQIAAGLSAAHEQGLVHRDIKPANILLEDGVERVTITDFGLARAVDDASMTRTGVIAGTPAYMSPEQARGEAIDARSDLFSLGSVLYTICTGRPPFRAETSYGVLRRITDTQPRPIRETNPEVPQWLCGIISRLMAKQPEQRFSSAREVSESLEAWLAHVQQPDVIPPPVHTAQFGAADGNGKRSRSLKYLAGAGFALCLLFAGIVVLLELNKGTLRIESNADDIPVRIMQGDTLVEKLTVSATGASVRIAAGKYVVTIEGNHDRIVVGGGSVSLQRGGLEVVTITESDAPTEPNAPATRHSDRPQDSPGPRRSGVDTVAGVEKFINLPSDTEVHIVGCYWHKGHHAAVSETVPIDVHVSNTGKPMVVVLTAYHRGTWNVHIDEGADVRGIIMSGYFEQRFSHFLPGHIPVIQRTYFPLWKRIAGESKAQRVAKCFYVWSLVSPDFPAMTSLIREMTGREPATFQGEYYGASFVIDGQSGSEEFQLAERWQSLHQRADRASLDFRRAQAELEDLENDTTIHKVERHRRMHQRMDEFKSRLNSM